MDEPNTEFIAKAYDVYHGNGLYEDRYPNSNQHVTERIYTHVAHLPQTAKVLDYGCGSGRYLLELLKHPHLMVYGFDVSNVAIQIACKRLDVFRYRVSLFSSQDNLKRALQSRGDVDVVLLLFGVLSHIEGQAKRREVLQFLFDHLAPQSGVLLVSVPNRWRRFWGKQLTAKVSRSLMGSRNLSKQETGIYYERGEGEHKVSLYYYLYSCRELLDELKGVGFSILRVKPENIFPEKWVTQHAWLASLDQFLSSVLPACFGYGILVEARRP